MNASAFGYCIDPYGQYIKILLKLREPSGEYDLKECPNISSF